MESRTRYERPSGLLRPIQPSPLRQPGQSDRLAGDLAGLVHDPAPGRPLAQRAPPTRPGGGQVGSVQLEPPALCPDRAGRRGSR